MDPLHNATSGPTAHHHPTEDLHRTCVLLNLNHPAPTGGADTVAHRVGRSPQRQFTLPAWTALCALLCAQSLLAWPMPRIPKEQIPDDMAPELRKHVEGL